MDFFALAFLTVIIAAAAILIVKPASVASFFYRLSHSARAYPILNPERVRRSAMMKTSYRIGGIVIWALALPSLGFDPLRPSAPAAMAFDAFVSAATPVVMLGSGTAFLVDPGWWERLTTDGSMLQQPGARFRLRYGYQVLGVLFLVMGAWLILTKLRP